MSIRADAAKFDISYPTLCKHIIKGSTTKLRGRFRRTFSNDQESELVCITRLLSCLWHGWSSYSICLTVYSQRLLFVDQSSTGFSRSSWIARRLSASPVTCRPSLLSPAAFLKATFWDPSSFFYILLMSQTLHCAVNWTDDTHLYVHCDCDAVNCAAEAARLAACIRGTRWMGIILL